jgi:hypothetical protein
VAILANPQAVRTCTHLNAEELFNFVEGLDVQSGTNLLQGSDDKLLDASADAIIYMHHHNHP